MKKRSFLQSVVTTDESWFHFTPETKTDRWSRGILRIQNQKSKNHFLYRKNYAFIRLGYTRRHAQTKQRTINAEYYSKQPYERRVKMPALCSLTIVRALIATHTMTTIKCTVLSHPPYSPELVPSDFHLFGPLREC